MLSGFLSRVLPTYANEEKEQERSFGQDNSMQLDTPEVERPTPSSQATLVDLLVKAFPDSDIQAPQIVIVGAQSSGKTKLIISMIFFRLIRHPHFTDEMGDILLQVFRTGSGLMTRRPIKVSLLNSPDRDICSINFRHNNDSFDFDNAELPNFISRLHDFDGDEIFETPLEITIRAYQLPNIQFTDMPGLRSKDIPLSDTRHKTLKNLVTEWIAIKSNTVVAVESAPQLSAGRADTSLLQPIMKELSLQDSSLKNRSILVLTKCDKINPEAFATDVMPIYGRQQQLDHLYRCIVCVVNKIDGHPEPHAINFADFRRTFEALKEMEDRLFRERGNLKFDTQCTTLAVENRINEIYRTLLSEALQFGYNNIRAFEGTLRRQFQREFAPPANLYGDNTPTNEQLLSKAQLIKEIKSVVINCASNSLCSLPLFEDAEEEIAGNKGLLLQIEIGLEWPTIELGNIEEGLNRRKFFEKVKTKMEAFVRLMLSNIDQLFMQDGNDAFDEESLSFHHLHRFTKLKSVLQKLLSDWRMRNESQLLDFLDRFMTEVWMHKGHSSCFSINSLAESIYQARHYIFVECIALLNEYLKKLQVDLTPSDIWEEAVGYVDRRRILNIKYEKLLMQQESLEQCLSVLKSDESNHESLESIIQNTHRRLEALVEPTLHWEPLIWKDLYQQFEKQQRRSKKQKSPLQSPVSGQQSQPVSSHLPLSSQSQPVSLAAQLQNAPAEVSIHNGASSILQPDSLPSSMSVDYHDDTNNESSAVVPVSSDKQQYFFVQNMEIDKSLTNMSGTKRSREEQSKYDDDDDDNGSPKMRSNRRSRHDVMADSPPSAVPSPAMHHAGTNGMNYGANIRSPAHRSITQYNSHAETSNGSIVDRREHRQSFWDEIIILDDD